MKCPICWSPFVPAGGQNHNDYACSNHKYCSAKEISYHPHISVIENWYFLGSYHLPFRSDGSWFALIGPERDFKHNKFIDQTILQELTPASSFFGMAVSSQKNLLSMTYFALPANSDFNDQFEILVEKAIGLLSIK